MVENPAKYIAISIQASMSVSAVRSNITSSSVLMSNVNRSVNDTVPRRSLLDSSKYICAGRGKSATTRRKAAITLGSNETSATNWCIEVSRSYGLSIMERGVFRTIVDPDQ